MRRPKVDFINEITAVMQDIFDREEWDEHDVAELATFVAISLEIMQTISTSKFREAVRTVELRAYVSQERRPQILQ